MTHFGYLIEGILTHLDTYQWMEVHVYWPFWILKTFKIHPNGYCNFKSGPILIGTYVLTIITWEPLTPTRRELNMLNTVIRISAICLQETWLSDKHETSIFNLPGYRLIHAGKSCSDCGGLMIYLSDLFSCNVKHVYNNSSLWEGLFIEVQGGTLDRLIIGNIYRPPRHNNNNATIENFLTEITPVISNIAKNSCNIVVSGDFNIDLLQINDRVKYQMYFDVFVTNSLFHLIALPIRESKHSSTLIDQIFCKLKNFRDLYSSGILISSLSDHYPCFALLDICKKKLKPKFITINTKNEQALVSFCTEVETSLNKWQINNDLMTDPNENYNIFEKIILDAKTKHLSPKSVWFKKYKHKISPWINNWNFPWEA